MLVQEAHTLSEGAGATATAGAYKQRESLAGRKVSITVSGANTTAAQLVAALETYSRMEG